MKQAKQIAAILILAGMGVLAGYAVGKLGIVDMIEFGISPLWLLPILPLSIFLAIFLHELGHALMGWAMGFEFKALTTGPLIVRREAGRWRFGLNNRLNLAGGLTLSFPATQERLARRFAYYVAGGPLASLLVALLCFALHHALPDGLPRFLCWVLGLMSLAIFVAASVPFRSGGMYSDGLRLWRFLKGGPEAEADAALLAVVAQSMSGTRPRELQLPALLAIHESAPPDSHRSFSTACYAYTHALDQRRLDEAAEHLARIAHAAEALLPPAARGAVYLEQAFMAAYAQGDAAVAKVFLEKCPPSPFIPIIQRQLAIAAIARAEGDAEALRHAVDTGLAAQHQAMDAGSAKMQADLLRELLDS